MPLVAYVAPNVLPVIAAAAVWVTVVSLSILSSTFSSNELYMLLLFLTYPCCPDVFLSWIKVRRLVYASWMKVLRMGYVLVGIASHVSNSFNGKIPDAMSSLTALLMICLAVYGSPAIVWISWHYSKR
jgi:hypothetical protein